MELQERYQHQVCLNLGRICYRRRLVREVARSKRWESSKRFLQRRRVFNLHSRQFKKNPIYLGSRGKVFSLEDIQGRWNLKTIAVISEEWICSIYNSEGILYVGTNLGNVYALDKMSYKPKLINSYPSPVVKISRLNSQIVVFHFNGTIACLMVKFGKFKEVMSFHSIQA